MTRLIIIAVICYLIGAIPFSYIFSRWFGSIDIRKHGSGNVGATNVLRNLGWPVALLAVTGDILKGFLAAWLGMHYGGEILAAICSLAAVVGHAYPIFLRFKGGKGVATSAGALLYITPLGVLILLGVFVLTIFLSRFVSLGSVLAALCCPFIFVLVYGRPYLVGLGVILALIIIYKHKDNIQRLRDGIEPRIGEGK
ncbi:MAG: glycerol-3-phosphate 1-O-acyltransferase PlsY [Chitinophagales bacterium]